MEQPSRRRRPVTYGKSTRKRISEINDFAGLSEIFASPRAPPSYPPEIPEREQVRARIPQARQAAKPTGIDKQAGKQNIKPARPVPLHIPSDDGESNDGGIVRKKSAGSLSVRTKVPEAAGKAVTPEPPADTGIYDVPDSEDEEPTLPTSPRVQKRKRNFPAATTAAVTSREKAPAKKEPALVTDTLAEEMATNGKRPRPARSTTEPVTRKIIPDAKITKPARAQVPQEGAEKRRKAEKVEKSVAVPAKSTQTARPTVTRPVTQKPAEPPEVCPKEASAAAARRPPAPKRMMSMTKAAPRPAETGKSVIPKLSATEGAASISEGEFMDSLDELMNGYTPEKPAGTLLSGMQQKVSSPTRPQLRKANTDIPKTTAMDLDFFGESRRTPTPPRKRLIDSLGGDPSRPAKRSCTSSGSDDGEDSSVGFTNGSQSQPFGSQSQTQAMESQQEQGSQEVEVLTVPKPSLASGRIGPKITYARERSYRAEEATLDEMALLSMPLPAMSTYGGRRRLETKKAEEDVVDDGSKPAGVKSIHELRAAGEHSRFTDDLEEILGDADTKQSISLQRNAYHKLTTKLGDRKFLQKCRAAGFDERILAKLDLITDEIISFTVSFIALCLLHDDTTPRTMLQLFNNGARQMLVRMLGNPKDIAAIARDRKTNMSRAARESVGDLVALVKASPAFPESAKASLPSPQLMALKVLETLVRKLREYGNHDSILPQGAVNTLVGIVAPFAGVKEYPRALEKNSRIATLELAMSILESYSLGGRVEFGRELSQDELSKLAAVFPTMLNWAQGVNLGTDHDLGMSILIAIRLYINISNEQPDVSDVIGPLLTPAVVGLVKKSFAVLEGTPEEQERKAYQDILILSFGLLLNFAESSAASRESVRTIAISEDTDGTGIEELLDIFTAKLQKTAEAQSVEETEANVGWGYLSILLGELCRDDHVRYRVRSQLNGGLTPLVEAIEEFIAYNKTVDGVLESAAHRGLTARFQEIVDRLRSYG